MTGKATLDFGNHMEKIRKMNAPNQPMPPTGSSRTALPSDD